MTRLCRRRRAVDSVLAAAFALASLVSLTLLAAPRVAAADLGAAADSGESTSYQPEGCAISASTTAPSGARVGEIVSVTHQIAWVCPRYYFRTVLVLDGGISEEPAREAQRLAAIEVATALFASEGPNVLASVVEYTDSPTVLCPLTDNLDQVVACIEAVGTGGTSDPSVGLLAAQAELRGNDDVPRDRTRDIVFLASGSAVTECAPLEAASGELKSDGVLVVSYCPGAGFTQDCLRRSATSPRYYFEGVIHFTWLERAVDAGGPRRVLVTDALDTSAAVVVPGSIIPPGEGGEYVRWDIRPPASGWRYDDSVRVGYRVRLTRGGELALPISTTLTLVEGGEATFAGPKVMVEVPTVYLPRVESQR